jgi:hypothetical protein
MKTRFIPLFNMLYKTLQIPGLYLQSWWNGKMNCVFVLLHATIDYKWGPLVFSVGGDVRYRDTHQLYHTPLQFISLFSPTSHTHTVSHSDLQHSYRLLYQHLTLYRISYQHWILGQRTMTSIGFWLTYLVSIPRATVHTPDRSVCSFSSDVYK